MKKNNISLVFVLLILHFTFLISNSSIVYAIEVGGHLIEDTTWSPENNPYLVTENLYVDSGITLTILPGTVVKIFAAPLTNYNDSNENFWLYNGDSVAKMIWVDGKILAEGTEQDSIIFDRIQDDINYNWGSIYMTVNAELSVFKHCKINNANGIWVAVSVPTKGLCFKNGKGIISNCSFLNNAVSIYSTSYIKELAITDNNFIINDEVNPFYPSYNYGRKFIVTVLYGEDDPSQKTLISNNNFYGIESYSCLNAEYLIFTNNMISNCTNIRGIGHFLENEFIDCDIGITGGDVGDSIYIKNNRFIGGYDGIDIDYAYVEISDNNFEGCDLDTGLQCSGKIFNNKIDYANVRSSGYLEVYNNIGFAGEDGIIVTYRNETCNNNLSVLNQYAFDGAFSGFFDNCIFIANEEISNNGVSGNPIFRNCILDFELPPECIDGGGNIWVDSLQAQTLFEDIQNGDFHLIEGSLAIDAGFDTLGYYYPFDMDYNHRVWDGDNNGSAIIDIGPYEYNSSQFGGITGTVYQTENGDFLDYVLLKINNQPGEFTFADSIGNYKIKLPAGVYDIYAERVFYEDAVVYDIFVNDGEFTEIDLSMNSTVNVEDFTIPNQNEQIFHLSNYPNPFNPSTNISFSISNDSYVELSIYNIKGQKIKTLLNEKMQKGKHSIIWSGLDSNNKPVGSGIYLYKVKAGNFEAVKRMILLK